MSRADWSEAPDESDDNANHPDPQLSKQVRYRDSEGEDWIDEFARSSTPEEFRGAMRFSIGKYVRRVGRKDAELSEVRKMRDYCQRWEEYLMRAARVIDDSNS